MRNQKRNIQVNGRECRLTRTEYDPVVDEIQEALNGIESFHWNLNDVMFEEETMFIHYSWRWRLL